MPAAGGTDELYSRLTEEDETRVVDTPSPLPGLNSKRSGLVRSAAASSRCKQEQEQDWTTGGETGKQGCSLQGTVASGGAVKTRRHGIGNHESKSLGFDLPLSSLCICM